MSELYQTPKNELTGIDRKYQGLERIFNNRSASMLPLESFNKLVRSGGFTPSARSQRSCVLDSEIYRISVQKPRTSSTSRFWEIDTVHTNPENPYLRRNTLLERTCQVSRAFTQGAHKSWEKPTTCALGNGEGAVGD